MSVHHFFESHERSILKTVTWKTIATTISFLATYYETGDVVYAMEFSGTLLAIGIVAYYLHERAWNSIHWGKKHLGEHV